MQEIASGVGDEEQDAEDELKTLLGKEVYEKMYLKIKSDLKRESGEEVDKLKFKKLIADYKKFKKNNVRHFKLNSASEQKAYGKR